MLMIDHDVAVEHVRRHRRMVLATLVLLLIAFTESLYISCARDYSPLFCPLSWTYAVLAAAVALVLWHYRK
jgi:fatty acid desaturase